MGETSRLESRIRGIPDKCIGNRRVQSVNSSCEGYERNKQKRTKAKCGTENEGIVVKILRKTK